MKTLEDIFNEEISSSTFSTPAGSGGDPVGGFTPSNYVGTKGAGGKDGYGKKKKKKYLFQRRQLPEMLKAKTDTTISDERLKI